MKPTSGEHPQPLSERLGVLSRAQLQAALDRFDLGRLLDVRATTSGLFGQNAFLVTDTGEWVLRGAPHWPWQFAKERFFAERLHRHTAAPVPWPYLVEESEDIFGWSYALMPRLPGVPPQELRDQLGLDQLREVAHVMGAGLGELQRLAADVPGEYDEVRGCSIRAKTPFRDWALASMEELQTSTSAIPGALDDADVALVEEVVEAAREALGEPFQARFVHGDYKEGNVLVERAHGRWRLSGVFDLMTSSFGDGEQDLSRATAGFASADREAARRFIAAYRARRPFRAGHHERFRLYMIWDRMILWHYGRRNRVWFPEKMRFRDFAKEPLSLDSLLDE